MVLVIPTKNRIVFITTAIVRNQLELYYVNLPT